MRRIAHFGIAALFVGGGISGAQVLAADPAYLPYWKAATIACWVIGGAFILTGLFSWWRDNTPFTPEPNLTLHKLILDRVGTDDFASEYTEVGAFGDLAVLLGDIRQAARIGRLTVWGRKGCDIEHDHIPLSEIPMDHWQDHEIDSLEVSKGGIHLRGHTTADVFSHRPEYTDLRFDRRQARTVWPRRLPKIVLRSPIAVEKRR